MVVKQSDAMSNQISIVHIPKFELDEIDLEIQIVKLLITFRRQHVLKLKCNVMKTSRCKINLI